MKSIIPIIIAIVVILLRLLVSILFGINYDGIIIWAILALLFGVVAERVIIKKQYSVINFVASIIILFGLYGSLGPSFALLKAEKLFTPLHKAASSGQNEIVKQLIAQGADLNALDATLSTPLDRAKRRPLTAAILRKHGAKTGEELKSEGK